MLARRLATAWSLHGILKNSVSTVTGLLSITTCPALPVRRLRLSSAISQVVPKPFGLARAVSCCRTTLHLSLQNNSAPSSHFIPAGSNWAWVEPLEPISSRPRRFAAALSVMWINSLVMSRNFRAIFYPTKWVRGSKRYRAAASISPSGFWVQAFTALNSLPPWACLTPLPPILRRQP